MEGLDLILVAAIAFAASVELGATAGVAGALADDPPEGDGRASLGPAGTLRTRLEVGFGAAALRFQVASFTGPGRDTVYWWEEGWQASADHWTWLGGVTVGAGPMVRVPLSRSVQLGAGATGGIMGIGAFHDFGGRTQYLLDPKQNDLDDPDNLDPYTIQAVPSAELVTSLRVGRRLAAELELGYTLALVPAADLSGTPPESSARRTAFTLGAVFIALGVSAPLASGN